MGCCVCFSVRMPLVSPGENAVLFPMYPRDVGHLRGDVGVSEVLWVLSCLEDQDTAARY